MKISIAPVSLERLPRVGEWFVPPGYVSVFVRIADDPGVKATGVVQSPAGRIYATCVSSGQVCFFDRIGYPIVQPVGGTLNLEYVRPN